MAASIVSFYTNSEPTLQLFEYTPRILRFKKLRKKTRRYPILTCIHFKSMLAVEGTWGDYADNVPVTYDFTGPVLWLKGIGWKKTVPITSAGFVCPCGQVTPLLDVGAYAGVMCSHGGAA